jgi:hypothetical protein
MAMAGRCSGLLVQALRELGKEHITSERIEHLKRNIPLDTTQDRSNAHSRRAEIQDAILISERPKDIEGREVPGH